MIKIRRKNIKIPAFRQDTAITEMVLIDIELMRRFLYVAQENSISKAAEKLFITQQALSKSMSKLEKEIGFPLLETNPEGVRLTELGRRCYPVISNVVKKYDSSLEIMKGFVVKDDLELSVLLEFQYFPYILPRDLFSKIGDMKVKSAIAENRKQCQTDVKAGKYDLSIVVRPEEDALLSGLVYLPIRDEGVYIMMSSGSPLAQKEQIDIEDLRNETFVMPASDYTFFQPFINACLAHDFYPHFSDETIGLSLCLQKVADKEGILLTPDLGDAMDDNTELVIRPLSEPDLRMELGVLARDDYQSHIMIRSYINALKIMMQDTYHNFML